MSVLIEVFANEIAMIKDPVLKKHVIEIIKLCPDYVSRMPSSSTGKYHPPDEVGKENTKGMIIHIKRLCALAPEMARKHSDDEYPETNFLVAGAILHDIFKNGEVDSSGNPKSKWTNKNHPRLIYELIHKYIEDNNLTEDEAGMKLRTVANACLFHEGRWTVEQSRDSFKAHDLRFSGDSVMDEFDKQVCRDMHEIDYWASRRTMFNIMQLGAF